MPKLTLETLGLKVIEKREDIGIRETAKQIGISSATLSRVERGNLPDLETFKKICRWLKVDPGEVLGMKTGEIARPIATAHFRKDGTLEPETAKALADLIIKAHRALVAMAELEESRHDEWPGNV
jgi:transcriptional regulator with XRE-family HTH domain